MILIQNQGVKRWDQSTFGSLRLTGGWYCCRLKLICSWNTLLLDTVVEFRDNIILVNN
jgi:hypothetical protein